MVAFQDLPFLAWTVMARPTRLGGQNLGRGPGVEVAPGAIGEAGGPPAFEGSSSRRR